MDFPTWQDLFRVYRDEALARNAKLTRDVIEREGSDANAIGAGGAAIGDELVGQLTRVSASLYLDSAEGQALDRFLFDRYGLLRKPASPAIGTVDFTTIVAAPAQFSIPVDTKLVTSDGKVFLTSVAAVFPFGSVGPLAVAVRSSKAGLDQQAAAGTISNIVGPVPGAPGDLAASNPLATTGADNEEEDDDYRDRGRRFFITARRGTVAAVEAQALAVPGVVRAKAIEHLDRFGRPDRAVQLIIADKFTEALVDVDPTPATYQAQSQVLSLTVFAALSDTRPAGIYVDVFVAKVVLQGVALGLSFDAGVVVDEVALRARAAVVGHVNSLSPGDVLEVGDVDGGLIRTLRKVPGLAVTGAEILSPLGDVVPGVLEVLRTSLGQVVATSIQPDQALQGSANPDGV